MKDRIYFIDGRIGIRGGGGGGCGNERTKHRLVEAYIATVISVIYDDVTTFSLQLFIQPRFTPIYSCFNAITHPSFAQTYAYAPERS